MSATGNSDPSSSYIGQECEPKLERPEPPIHDSQFRPHMPASVGSMLTFSVELLPFLLRFFFMGDLEMAVLPSAHRSATASNSPPLPTDEIFASDFVSIRFCAESNSLRVCFSKTIGVGHGGLNPGSRSSA